MIFSQSSEVVRRMFVFRRRHLFCGVVLVACCASVSGQEPLANLFDAPDDASVVDLAKTPLWLDVFRHIAVHVTEEALKRQFDEQTRSLVPKLTSEIGDTSNGYLLRVQIYADELDVPIIPGGQLVISIGRGTEPIDALAEHLRQPQMSASLPAGAKNNSYYIWIKKRDGKLGGWSIPRSFRRQLENMASAEADRREKLGAWTAALPPGGLVQLKRSAYWNDVAQKNVFRLQDDKARAEVSELGHQFAAKEAKFNELYKRFQNTVAEMAAVARRNETLDQISAFVSVVSSGIQASQLVCDVNGKAPNTSASPGETTANEIKYVRTESLRLKDMYIEQKRETLIQLDDLNSLNSQLRDKWQNFGISPPAADPLPSLEPTQ